ncbi:helix-turn-helix domain-containing protein [Saccharothrix australiensis]|uniref:AraC-like DNA-binding protein n=1 Tax=Saccharothrix australiensis TaxID=2072 RepID=A0A495VXQ8_9PSEU|nr:helix-turn-helix transcriptional regulator [Saccharothrix australiensis]RKT53984.1 AraC-like DNA-binding protein [Saccharothrix australiensis]
MADWSIVVPRRAVERADPLVFGTPAVAGVLSYSAHDTSAGPQRWTVSPLGAVTFTIDLTTPDRGGLPWSPVIGPRDRPLTATQSGRAVGITVGLSPPAAHALFGPLRELANTTPGLVDLLGRDAHLLAERLAEVGRPARAGQPDQADHHHRTARPTNTAHPPLSTPWQARFRLLDRLLAERLARGPAPDDAVRVAWRRLAETGGTLRIGALADEIGWTRQHLVTRFRDQLGLTPKTAARTLRLHRAASLLPTAPPARVAADCGYADQSHLNRDFRALTGITPTAYAGRRDPARARTG